MKEFSGKQIITFRWWREDLQSIDESETSWLRSIAYAHINDMRIEGFTSGELKTELDDIAYRGVFEIHYPSRRIKDFMSRAKQYVLELFNLIHNYTY